MTLDHAVAEDRALVEKVASAVRSAGARMLERFDTAPRLAGRDEVVAGIYANDAASLAVLRPELTGLRPQAGWVDDELESGPLPPGEWWVTDPIEGNINHVHGMPEWGVTATLVRDNVPIVTVVHLPLTGETYTGVRSGGAFLDGVPLRHSPKTGIEGALVGTGQAKPGESAETFARIGASVTAMLNRAMVIRVSVPATLQLIQVAAGRMEAFWQFSQVRSGLLAGSLLVAEAGGVVTDTHGRPWSLDSDDFLATTPAMHPAAVEILSAIA
ncbi:inositol monophosphatase family protein [Spongiactinospora sp. TRM90649]|uniref:inositol monophosphatase family protein n=1 Tax=Spongiactinospora sp. TRM90649 TaxID=3031114 RepID=UPI0023F81231|nr:inositol monophosphatase family protein [Spongiactinospora sp. TRM90649]MDF5753574.1 inositol monophosphatase family protein [Spongiactinospora sp. TRM90649]